MTTINKTLMVKRDGLRVIRLQLNAGASIPEHSVNAHVLVIPIKGQGTFSIDKIPQPISVGVALEMEPNVLHAVDAQTDLEFMLVQMTLASNIHNT